MKKFILQCILTLVSILSTNSVNASANEDFPARKLYPAVPVISVNELYKQIDKVVVVDVRSAYEYQTLRIVNAINIPLSSLDFVPQMRKLHSSNPGKDIVVYCNGKTCKKSYKATQKCRDNGINDVIAYDAGIFEWTRKYPAKAILLGESPVDPKRLISKSEFKKKLIDPKKFEALMVRRDVIVLDVRDSFQREGIGLFPGIEKRTSLDNLDSLDKYIDKAKKEKKTLLIYDAAGKQVRWLMYYLEKQGIRDYVFMKGGANAYFNSLRTQFAK